MLVSRTTLRNSCGLSHLVVIALAAILCRLPLVSAADNAADVNFFESRVRPVFLKSCVECHGPDRQESGLRLDTAAGFRKGTDTDKLINSGNPEDSLLLQVIRRDGEIKMPPDEALSAEAVADIAVWLSAGAHFPNPLTAEVGDAWKSHWAFQPISNPSPPADLGAGAINPIDAFVVQSQRTQGLAMSPPADRRTLLRRLSYDLTGLPPSLDDVEAFENDQAANAVEKVIDRLLASPHYGERWGRHWLDLVRYADANATVGDTTGQRLPFAYTYRDWVVSAFNANMPYDQFLIQQIAGDHSTGPFSEDPLAPAAIGFFTVARERDEEPDKIADWLDVLGRSTMGLTLACARCHTHKYDPITIADYYSLYGVFHNMKKVEVPLVGTSKDLQKFLAFQNEVSRRTAPLDAMLERHRSAVLAGVEARLDEYLVAARLPERPGSDDPIKFLSQTFFSRFQDWWQSASGDFHPVLGPWQEFTKLSAKDFPRKAPQLAKKFANMKAPRTNQEGELQPGLNSLVSKLFKGKPPQSLAEVDRRYVQLFTSVSKDWRTLVVEATADSPPERLPDAAGEEIRQELYGPGKPLGLSLEEFKPQAGDFLNDEDQEIMRALTERIDEYKASSAAVPFAASLEDPDAPEDAVIFKRGDANSPGETVPRQFLGFLSGETPQPFTQGTGRHELALAIASKDNPLTARVIANRVWMLHLGKPLVPTPSDFGLRGEPPTHPELLDFLASRLMGDDWSLKKLHKLILMSRTYQQSSASHADAYAVDPENRWLWRANRRRLDYEAIRDSLLVAANRLDTTVGGQPSDGLSVGNRRRTIYSIVDRQATTAPANSFDVASAILHTDARSESTVPQQALFLMNHPFVAEQSRSIANLASRSGSQQVRQVFEQILQRAPTTNEQLWASEFLTSSKLSVSDSGSAAHSRSWIYGRSTWDESAKRARNFSPLPFFTGDTWQMGPRLPHRSGGYLYWNAENGHPGPTPQFAAVRRWVSPLAGTLQIEGLLRHEAEGDPEDTTVDGVRAHLYSSRHGLLNSYRCKSTELTTSVSRLEVEIGEMIDAIVECGASDANDEFSWTMTLRLTPQGQSDSEALRWNATEDFAGPAAENDASLSPLELLAQALFLTNEFMYLD